VRPDCVVVPPPAFDDDLGFAHRVEDIAVEQLVAQARIETLDNPLSPTASRGDVGGLCADGTDSLLHHLGDQTYVKQSSCRSPACGGRRGFVAALILAAVR
jgi:hypothetical protein